jgi:hypothetical protein
VPDSPFDLVRPPGFEGVVNSGQQDLFWGELVVGFISDDFFEPCRDVRDPKLAELFVVGAGECHRSSSFPPWLS